MFLPGCDAILDSSIWGHARYVYVSNLCLLYLWLSFTISGESTPIFLQSNTGRLYRQLKPNSWSQTAEPTAGHFVDAVLNNSRLIQSREKMAEFFVTKWNSSTCHRFYSHQYSISTMGRTFCLLRLVNSLRIFYRWRKQNKKAYFLLQKGEEFDIWPILPKLDRGFKTISK